MIRLIALCCLLWPAAGPARADFVHNNLRFTLYHELGHAVIDQLDLHVFGTQETAADSFAIVLADRLLSEAEMTRLIIDVTDLGRQEAAEELFDPWDEYMPGAQRLARAICLYYGLDPAARGMTARALGMPRDSEWDCADDATVTEAAWAAVLHDLTPRPGSPRSLRPGRRGKALRLLSDDIARINSALTLPRPIPVIQVDCGEDNAFYLDVEERIEFCTEMVEALRMRRPQ